MTLWSFAYEYARYSLLTQPGVLPLGMVFAWVSLWSWTSYVWLIAVFLPLLYPDGRWLSALWRAVAWFALANMIAMAVITGLSPGTIDGLEPIINPLGMGTSPMFWQHLENLATVSFLATVLLATLSLIQRFRLSGPEQRAQIRWFLFVTVLFLLHAAYGISTDIGLAPELPFGLSQIMFYFLIVAFAFAIAVAILRYRLYDIDVIIRKTLIYGLLSAVLALVFFGSVTLMQSLFSAISGQQSAMATVLSTLVIAALFTPLRQRIQNAIDRRFFRQKYDAQQVLAQFAVTARDETDLDALTRELQQVVEGTMQPEGVGVWLVDAASDQGRR